MGELGMETCNDIEALEKRKEVTELKGMFKSNTHVSIEGMKLEIDNIFDAIACNKNEAVKMNIARDMMITMRSVLDKHQG